MTPMMKTISSSTGDTTRSAFGISNFSNQLTLGTSAGGWVVVPPESATLVYDQKIGVNIKTRIARLEKNPERAAALAKARERIGSALQSVDTDHEHTLASMRLRAGLSQARLAELMGTQQPNIARLEKNPAGLQAATVLKLAKALKVDPMEILALTSEKSEQATAHG